MSRNFYCQKDSLGFPIPGTMMFTTDAPIPANTYTVLPQTYTPGVYQQERIHTGGLRYFVRKEPNGDIIPNTLFISTTQPRGLWWELKVFYNAPGIHPLADITDATLNYVAGSGPSAGYTQLVSIYHVVPGENITYTLNAAHFELSVDGTTWVTTGSLTIPVGTTDPFVQSIHIRAKAGLTTASYVDVLTVSNHTVLTPVTCNVTAVIS